MAALRSLALPMYANCRLVVAAIRDDPRARAFTLLI